MRTLAQEKAFEAWKEYLSTKDTWLIYAPIGEYQMDDIRRAFVDGYLMGHRDGEKL